METNALLCGSPFAAPTAGIQQERRMADINNPDRNLGASRADLNTGATGRLSDIDWASEDAYWSENFSTRPYVRADRGYNFYRPAYRYGVESRARFGDRHWDDIESDLSRGWNAARGESSSAWEHVKDAVRDGWDRVRGRR
jgi:hypothetical protein